MGALFREKNPICSMIQCHYTPDILILDNPGHPSDYRFPCIIGASIAYAIAIGSLLHHKLKIRNLVRSGNQSGENNINSAISFKAEINLTFIGYWPVLMHTLANLIKGQQWYPWDALPIVMLSRCCLKLVKRSLKTKRFLIFFRIGVILFNGSTPLIQLATSSKIRGCVKGLLIKLRCMKAPQIAAAVVNQTGRAAKLPTGPSHIAAAAVFRRRDPPAKLMVSQLHACNELVPISNISQGLCSSCKLLSSRVHVDPKDPRGFPREPLFL